MNHPYDLFWLLIIHGYGYIQRYLHHLGEGSLPLHSGDLHALENMIGNDIALGIAMVLVEIFINITFQVRSHLAWSYIPLIILVLTGLFFIVVAIVKPFREALSKIFFI